eukprot:TRINITY_DN6450_c0_g4_i1.p1 TRINITY_DN6450_c0_g4~~TRINITY_DN6450_c0_g4_i1.p1  ORF type:complete len:1447 (+),score=225.31 TRINITY_DN6450_c0_g4_i1:242-4582(+)
MEGAKVYVRDGTTQWQKATVVGALGGGRYRVQLQPWEDAEPAATLAGASPSELALVEDNCLENTLEIDASTLEGGSLPFQNSDMPAHGFPNMTTLDHLHEAALLHNLRVRFFAASSPYTYTADIVIAINPYQWHGHLYTDEQRKEYLVFDRNKLPPHVYATSGTAYSGLQEKRVDQSILVSGESGAGKTETVKILMAHLALIASSDDTSHIQRIVESNPLLESFGNAQTVRNDNSSRFGKFIELQLNDACRLSGSNCRTYLLEKSRVVGQDSGERNYHIFYQMLATDVETRASFGLDDVSHTRDEMRYTGMGASKTDTIEGKHDGARFQDTMIALALVGVDGILLQRLLRALASVLLLGQVEFESEQDDISFVKQSTNAEVAGVAAQLEVEVSALGRALTHRTIRTRDDEIEKPLSCLAACATRDALAKELYSRVFDWLVGCICCATAASPGSAKHFVGLLDIFGFESFAINRFEQLCINFANEKLQQKFTHDVFKEVQQEYNDEGIPWDKIEFNDNSPILALIEKKLGIIAMLNEECVRPMGSDVNFVSKLSTVHKADPAFSTPRVGKQKEFQFTIKHYAGSVTYTATGWLERNKDTVSEDVMRLMRSSRNALIAEIFSEPALSAECCGGGGLEAKSKASSDTVATKFRASLAQLMETVGRTSTQYVRCIKPNKNKSPVEMDNPMVVDQLRCAGVVEAIRISRAGFPARMPLGDFTQRFSLLGRTGVVGNPGSSSPTVTAATCRTLLAALVPDDSSQYVIGRTRVYFKRGVLEALEERRALLFQSAATELTRRVRGYQVQRRFRHAQRAAKQLQATWRMYRCRQTFLAFRAIVVVCQGARRAVLARRFVADLRLKRCATRLQSFHRGRLAMRSYQQARGAAIKLQAVARRRACRRQYLIGLAEFKEQAKLENQVKALQAKLAAAEQAAQTSAIASVAPAQCASEPSAELLEALNAQIAENARLRAENDRQRNEIVNLRRENQQLRAGQSTRSDWLNSVRRSKKHQPPTDEERRRSASQERYEAGLRMARSNSGSLVVDAVSTGVSTDSLKKIPSVATVNAATASSSVAGATADANSKVLRPSLYPPLSPFWEDVPCSGLPLLSSGSEVHIKIGPNLLLVDETSKNLVWKPWMDPSRGYRCSTVFHVERRATDTAGAAHSGGVEGLECGLGHAFSLRSALTGRYVAVGAGILDRHCLRVSSMRLEDAAVFTFVPLSVGGASYTGGGASTEARGGKGASSHWGAIRLLGDSRVLSLRSDGHVSMAASSNVESEIRHERMASAIEYLRPCTSYELVFEEEQIGLVLDSTLPLRVASFKGVPSVAGVAGPGAAERSGRVHVGDIITRVNGQDISGIPRTDAVTMITCKRPVILGFVVGTASNEAASPAGRAPAVSEKEAPARKRFSLVSFAKSSKAYDYAKSSKTYDKVASATAQLRAQVISKDVQCEI